MATSCRPGCLGLSQGPWAGARTAGPLGLCDQGDPYLTTLLGDTPGPLGMQDWADPTLARFDTHCLPFLGAIGRTADGTAISVGLTLPLAAPQVPAGEVTLALAQEMALKITTVFEGGTSMNYKALAGDFDGQGTSFGLIQWNFGQNTLGPLLKLMLAADAAAFAGCFHKDADYDTLKKALDGNKKDDQLTWARDLQKDHKAAWTATFSAIGSVDTFNRIQREQAASKYHPIVVADIASLRAISTDLPKTIEFRSYAALFDTAVQQNGIGKASEAIKSRVATDKPTTQLELMKIAVEERGKKASGPWVSDCISRRLGILGGAARESTENNVTKKRPNAQYSLIVESGSKVVSGL